jgi:WD40 repeat protein
MLRVQTGLKSVDYLCLTADGSRLAVSQISGGREVWSSPFASAHRIHQIAEPRWPGAGPIDEERKSWWPGAMSKLVFEPTGGLMEAGVLATVPSLAVPTDLLSLDDEESETSTGEADLQDFCLSSDGCRLLTATGNMDGYDYRGYLRKWSRSGISWKLLWTVPSDYFDIHAVAFLPNLARVLVAEENLGRDPDRPEVGKYSSLLTLRDERTGDLITENYAWGLFDELQQFAVGGVKPVVVLGNQRQLHVYDPADLTAKPRVIQTEWANLRGMLFHPSGRFLLTVAEGPSVSILDTETWKVIQQFDWEIGNLRSVGVSMDGFLAAVGSDTGIVTVWDWEI